MSLNMNVHEKPLLKSILKSTPTFTPEKNKTTTGPWWCVAAQTAGCLAAVAQLCVQGTFLALEAVARQYMVSDGLEYSAWYRVALTASVLAGLACSGIYLLAQLYTPRWFCAVVGCFLLKGAVATWCVLAFVSFDSNEAVHVGATCAFVACSTGYVLTLLYLHRANLDPYSETTRAHAWYDWAWYALIALAAATCAMYMGIYFTDRTNAWIPEQICLMLFTAAQLAFFYNHRPHSCGATYQSIDGL